MRVRENNAVHLMRIKSETDIAVDSAFVFALKQPAVEQDLVVVYRKQMAAAGNSAGCAHKSDVHTLRPE
jgi:hypothetical protein